MIGVESTSTQMIWLGEQLLGYGRFYQPSRLIENIQKVTADDITAVACDILRARRASVAMIVSNVDTVPEADAPLERLYKRRVYNPGYF